MFQSLRTNSPVYIFHKGNVPSLEVGYVSSIMGPKPKYTVPPTFGQPQEMVVDIIVKVGTKTNNYTSLPAQADVADSYSNGESIVISDSKEAMNSEIISLKQRSIDIVNSVDFHKELIDNCDKVLSDLNPEFAEKKAQRVEIDELKQQLSAMSKNITDLMESNKLLVGKLKEQGN